MRWPWSRRVRDGEGAKARKEAAAKLRTDLERWPEVNRVASSLRELRQRNHFAATVSNLFQGGEQ